MAKIMHNTAKKFDWERSMQLFLDLFHVLNEGIAESRFDGGQLLEFEMASGDQNHKKTKPTVVGRSQTIAPGYSDLTLVCPELERAKSLPILGVTLDSSLTFVTHLRQVVVNSARSLFVVPRTGKLFDCSRLLKSYFNAYVLYSSE